MRPRANFSCANCGKKAGSLPVKIEDLPIDATRCPMCGHKRGFRRLFDAIGGVQTSSSRLADKVITAALDPLHERHTATIDGARSFEKAATDAIERSTHEASPQDRAKAKPFGGHLMAAQAAMSAIPSAARQDSRELVYPALTNRIVRPDWQR